MSTPMVISSAPSMTRARPPITMNETRCRSSTLRTARGSNVEARAGLTSSRSSGAPGGAPAAIGGASAAEPSPPPRRPQPRGWRRRERSHRREPAGEASRSSVRRRRAPSARSARDGEHLRPAERGEPRAQARRDLRGGRCGQRFRPPRLNRNRSPRLIAISRENGGGGNRTRVRDRTGQSVYKLRLPFAFTRRPVDSRPTAGLAILRCRTSGDWLSFGAEPVF